MIKELRSTLFWDVAWCLVVHSDVLGKYIRPRFRGQAVQLKMPQRQYIGTVSMVTGRQESCADL